MGALPPTRAAIASAYRRPEPECLPPLIASAGLAGPGARELARRLVTALRANAGRGGVEGLIHEYDLSSQEGVALMCLAEALLRIPDAATRDALIRDKIGGGDWRSHLGHSPSVFVNAATWGLLITGRLSSTSSESGLSAALIRLIGRGGEPLIRRGVDMAMRLMGEQFVTGQTIEAALANSRRMEARGFRYSYDMLGEAATTAEDATRYLDSYRHAIEAIGTASARRGIYAGPGISVKLSALHPRYSRTQRDRVMAELLPRLAQLAAAARRHDIGLNIDAEEADRLELSLDLLEALCADPALAGWDGVGFVVQAYQKRAPFVVDFLIELARRTGRRMMVRLVKGAYWDSEIKRAQVDGLADFPVYTRKVHTDVSYLACARRLLDAPDAVFPQFATHNAMTLAAIIEMAGPDFRVGHYEFQCLHGMGEPLYDEVVGPDKLGRPCRVYAPVGSHETLLAYLVRRLLENGANTSFVNRIADLDVPVETLIEDPVDMAARVQPVGAPHPAIALPSRMFGAERENSSGLDLSDDVRVARIEQALRESKSIAWRAGQRGEAVPVVNPADQGDVVGEALFADAAIVDATLSGLTPWGATPATVRAACLGRAAEALQEQLPRLVALLAREAGKTWGDGVAEVREAIDFLRYYAGVARDAATLGLPLGVVACISPWNFPLAIFTGQVAAALAAGNAVAAKPAEETPLVAAEAVRLLHEAGVPDTALRLFPGAGDVGAALVADRRVDGVLFTGSTEVARHIRRSLAQRLGRDGAPIPLIAETGGLNAMIVDSSALAEQVVGDVIASAFGSAGQRCSALRVLCVQEEIADRVVTMLRGAMAELSVGSPDRLSTDVGPVISSAARDGIEAHVAEMRAAGHGVHRLDLPEACARGSFVAPTAIEIDRMEQLRREVFGPVLHVLRWRREGLEALMRSIAATNYALTFGVQSRIDDTIGQLIDRSHAGNIYVNRSIIGAVVGVQPFGGEKLSGTGPKAGGPLYVPRLTRGGAIGAMSRPGGGGTPAAMAVWCEWLEAAAHSEAAERCRRYAERGLCDVRAELPGPVGERNVYSLRPRGPVLCVPATPLGLFVQVGVALASGNCAVVRAAPVLTALLDGLPATLRALVSLDDGGEVAACLFEGDPATLTGLEQELAAREGPLVQVQALTPEDLAGDARDYAPAWLMTERVVTTNTAAAGGNATLMSIG